jgi:hypothetical protein
LAGYSGTPLAKKLGLMPGLTVLTVAEPADYRQLVDPLPEDVVFAARLSSKVDLVHGFFTSAAELARHLKRVRSTCGGEVTLWVSWPKRASGVPTDITEDVIRALALPLGWVDVKVCAVDEVWSGLKLVVRKALR